MSWSRAARLSGFRFNPSSRALASLAVRLSRLTDATDSVCPQAYDTRASEQHVTNSKIKPNFTQNLAAPSVRSVRRRLKLTESIRIITISQLVHPKVPKTAESTHDRGLTQAGKVDNGASSHHRANIAH